MTSRNFCTTAELAAELEDPDLGVIDASWHLPNTARIGAADFRAEHIPGAVFFDIDTIADHDQGLPHMLPKPETLAEAMTALGLGEGMRFVVYDTTGLYAAARVWWMLRAYRVDLCASLREACRDGSRKAGPWRPATPIPSPARSLPGRRTASSPRSRKCDRRSRPVRPRSWTRGRRSGSAGVPGAPAWRQKRPHPRQPQPAVRRHLEHGASKPPTASRPPSPHMGSTLRSPSSPPAARA